jgi:signal transduction histidine kinase/ligand-binding sensor domain-containing protein/DNA-binding response OmpR family regulator
MKVQPLHIFLLFILFVLLGTTTINAQFRNMKFEYLNVDNGLSSNRTKYVLRDHEGFLWIGTERGLNRFDGLKIVTYLPKSSDKNSISDQDIYCIYEDRFHNLWIGTKNGLNLYDRKTESFKKYFTDKTNPNSLTNNTVTSITEDKQGNIWFTTFNGFNKINRNTQSFQRFFVPEKSGSVEQDRVVNICFDAKNNCWLATDLKKIVYFDTSILKFSSIPLPIQNAEIACPKTIALDSLGNVWIGTRGDGLFMYSPRTNIFKQLKINPVGGFGNKIPSINSITFDSNRYALISAFGINRIDLKTNSVEYCYNDAKKTDELSNNALSYVYKDKEGFLYACTSAEGLNICNPKRGRFTTYRYNPDANNSLIYNNIFKFFEDSQGQIWIGTDGGGISVFNPENKSFTNYQPNPKKPFNISAASILCIAEDKNHDIWAGSWGFGLYKFERKTKRFTEYSYDAKNSQTISSPNVWDIITDSKGHLWINSYELGIDVFDIKKGVIKRYRHSDTDSTSLIDNEINRINHQPGKAIGILTRKGYCEYDSVHDCFIKIKALEGINLNDVYYDKSGSLWAATSKNGLWILKLDGKIEKYDISNGFPTNSICGIVEDKQGSIWISTYSGISNYNVRTKAFRHFTIADGLQGMQFTNYARLGASDGTIYFGGYKGFNAFNPDNFKINTYIPTVYIDEFLIFNKPVTMDSPDSILKADISRTKQIELSYKQSSFTFGFTALNFTYPEKAIYAYKMEGYDKNWNYTDSKRRYTTYTNLDPGDYTFMVKATNNDEIWNENPTCIKITITPPFWKTWWFKTLVFLAITGSAFSFYRYRINQLKQQRSILQLKVKERTNALEEANEKLKEQAVELMASNEVLNDMTTELQDTNTQLEENQLEILQQQQLITAQNNELEIKNEQLEEQDILKTHFFVNISHELRTPLTLIINPLDVILKQTEQDNIHHHYFILMQQNARRMLRLVGQLLDIKKIDDKQYNLRIINSELVNFTSNIVKSFLDLAKTNHIELINKTIIEELSGWFDADIIEQIIFNLISNAIKFTPQNKKIEIEVISEPVHNSIKMSDYVKIVVSDTGIGIEEDKIHKVFDRFYQAEAMSTRKYQGSGIGLAICKELIELHQGNIYVESKFGEGSSFHILFPIKKNYYNPDQILETEQDYSLKMTPDLEIEKMQPIKLPKSSKLKNNKQEDNMRIILVVEDNFDLCNLISSELRHHFIVEEAQNGFIGWKKATRIVPDLIISDIMMPQMNGIQLCSKLKSDERTSHIPVILLTARTSIEHQLEGIHAQADDYVMKPFNIDVLKAKIENLIANRENLKQIYKNYPILQENIDTSNLPDEKTLYKLVQIIENNITNENLTAEFICREIGMSKTNLYRKLKATTGMSINIFIRNVRLKKAAILIRQSDMLIMDICSATGFQNVSHFFHSFKELYNVSPAQYKNNG